MKGKTVPMRKCIGCMESKEKNKLIRIASFEGNLYVDPTGKAKGRGSYICKGSEECLEKAYKRKAFERTVGRSLTPDEKEKLLLQIREVGT